jgi:hypothetical protein
MAVADFVVQIHSARAMFDYRTLSTFWAFENGFFRHVTNSVFLVNGFTIYFQIEFSAYADVYDIFVREEDQTYRRALSNT